MKRKLRKATMALTVVLVMQSVCIPAYAENPELVVEDCGQIQDKTPIEGNSIATDRNVSTGSVDEVLGNPEEFVTEEGSSLDDSNENVNPSGNPEDGSTNPEEPQPEEPAGSIPLTSANFPDTNFRTWIREHISGASDGVLTQEELGKVQAITIQNGVSDLTGIGYFANLQTLICKKNAITRLDLTKNTYLKNLDCSDNSIASLNVSGLNLLSLTCVNNRISSLDLTSSSDLTELSCSKNRLTSLDVSTCPKLTSLRSLQNTSLSTLNVTGCTSLKRLLVGFCNLSALDVSTNTSLVQLDCRSNTLKTLDVSQLVSLEKLNCQSNILGSLTVNGATNLGKIYCASNRLTALDVSALGKLQILNCSANRLTAVDVRTNAQLKELNCAKNRLTSINVTNNGRLTNLVCSSNQLTSLNVTNNQSLLNLSCYLNEISTLNLSGNPRLQMARLTSNPMGSVNLGSNSQALIQCDSPRTITLIRNSLKYKITANGEGVHTVTLIGMVGDAYDSTQTNLVIPSTVKMVMKDFQVTSIRKSSFQGYSYLKTVTIGKNVKNIGVDAFRGCTSLKNITIQSKNLKAVGDNAIKGISTKAVIQVPSGKVNDYKKLFGSKSGFRSTMKLK